MKKRKATSRKKRTPGIGEYLTRKRLEQGKTQEEIAVTIKKTRSFVCRVETGDRRRQCLRGSILYELAKAYDAPIEEVLEKANWPQLLLMDTTEEERQRLIRYLKEKL